ncbi:MAG: hypothetical protein ACKO0V_10395, partial [bacterium]
MSLDYSKVMQRDWHVVYLYFLTIVMLQTSRNASKYLLAGFIFAVALIIRPYAILFFPGVIVVMLLESDPARNFKRNIIEFVASSLFFSFIGFVPLLINDIFSDFLASVINELLHGKYTP